MQHEVYHLFDLLQERGFTLYQSDHTWSWEWGDLLSDSRLSLGEALRSAVEAVPVVPVPVASRRSLLWFSLVRLARLFCR